MSSSENGSKTLDRRLRNCTGIGHIFFVNVIVIYIYIYIYIFFFCFKRIRVLYEWINLDGLVEYYGE